MLIPKEKFFEMAWRQNDLTLFQVEDLFNKCDIFVAWDIEKLNENT